MEIKYNVVVQGGAQVSTTDCPHKKKTDNGYWYIKVGSAGCRMCRHNRGFGSVSNSVECNLNLK